MVTVPPRQTDRPFGRKTHSEPPWQCPSSAPAPRQGAPGGSGWLGAQTPAHWAPSHRPTGAPSHRLSAMPRYPPPHPQARALVTVLLHGATEHLPATQGTDGLRMLKTRLDRHFEDLD